MTNYTDNKLLQESLYIINKGDFDNDAVRAKAAGIWTEMISDKAYKIENLYHSGKITDWVECRTLIEENTEIEDELYSLLFAILEQTDWRDVDEAVFACKFVNVFASGELTIKTYAFANHAKTLQEVIKSLLTLKNRKILETDSFIHDGDMASVVKNLLELYFRHATYQSEYNYLRAFGAEVVYDFVTAFPSAGSNLIASLLQTHPKAMDEIAKIIVLSISKQYTEMFEDISSDMYGRFAYSSDYEYKNAFKILKKCFELKREWREEEYAFMIKIMFFQPLGLDFRGKNEKLEYLNNRLSLVTHPNTITSLKEEIKEVTTDYEGILKNEWITAYKRVAVAKTTYDSIAHVLSKVGDSKSENVIRLKKLFEDAKQFKEAPKLFNINNKPTTIFKDFGLKLLVIEELMYNQKVLKPMFTLDAFAQEYTKKEIDKQSDTIITEVKKFYTNLEIPTQLLKKVKTLYQDSGMGGGAEIYYNMIPLWDPGCGDEVIKVKLKAIDDLELLPNLKKVVGFENSKLSKKFMAELKKREIELVEEDT